MPLERCLLKVEVELIGANGPIRVRALLNLRAKGNFLSNIIIKEVGLK